MTVGFSVPFQYLPHWCAPGARFLVQLHGRGHIHPLEQMTVYVEDRLYRRVSEPSGDYQRMLPSLDQQRQSVYELPSMLTVSLT
jgi:hypothetical protein